MGIHKRMPTCLFKRYYGGILCACSWQCFTSLRTLEDAKSAVVSGIPELGIDSLDPMKIDVTQFTFFNLTTTFKDSIIRGFGDYKMEKCAITQRNNQNTWNLEFSVPKITSKESCQSLFVADKTLKILLKSSV